MATNPNKPRDKRSAFMKKAREGTQLALTSKDMLLGNVAKSIIDINKASNLMCERLEELYGVYFPELKIDDKEKYVKLILFLDKKNPDAKEISKLVGSGKSNEIINNAARSLGADLSEEDLNQCKLFAQEMNAIYALRENYEKYQEKLARELCPNICEVVGSDVAAKLVAHVGSLARLAVLPSSTIQVLGAERALFKHLKNKRIAPPKHGIIFQHVSISASPKKVRGKIARLLANKITTAAKADYFTKNNISPQLKKEFDDSFARIMADYERSKAKTPEKGKPPQRELK